MAILFIVPRATSLVLSAAEENSAAFLSAVSPSAALEFIPRRAPRIGLCNLGDLGRVHY